MSAVTLGEHNRSNCQSHTHPHTQVNGQRDKPYIYIYFYNIPSGGGIVRKVLCWRVEGHQELYTLECPVQSRPNTHTHTHTQQSGRFIRGGGTTLLLFLQREERASFRLVFLFRAGGQGLRLAASAIPSSLHWEQTIFRLEKPRKNNLFMVYAITAK